MQGEVGWELAEKLEAVYQVMGARGRVRQKRSRPLRAHVRVRCPKFSIQVETGTPAAPTHFQVAMHTLEGRMLAGSHQHRQLHSGAGPITLEVILQTLLSPRDPWPPPPPHPPSPLSSHCKCWRD